MPVQAAESWRVLMTRIHPLASVPDLVEAIGPYSKLGLAKAALKRELGNNPHARISGRIQSTKTDWQDIE